MIKIGSEKMDWEIWMNRALHLASLAEGDTSPNPLVGAIVLDENGLIIGEGFHSAAGKPPAEVGALTQAGEKAKGGTLIVTLEPCCHKGRTPPCTKAILNSGINRVVVGMKDPDPRVSGGGISILKDSGIEVISGVLEKEVAFQNRAFIFRIRTGRPWGILKWAMSIDGRIGLPNGLSQWISGEKSRKTVYKIRSKADAVIIGGGTLRSDNPLLTSRGLKNKEPLRVVFTKSLDLPKEAKLWDIKVAKTLIAYGCGVSDEKINKLPPSVEKLLLNSSQPIELLNSLALKGCNSVLWECGPSLSAQAIKQNCVQELMVFIAPKLLGGNSAMTPLGNLGFESMNTVIQLDENFIKREGNDLLLNLFI